MSRIRAGILFCLLFVGACAYFNTFYNAQNYFRQARKTVTDDTLKVDSELFNKTIEKATAVIVKYPNSRYVDDALFMMGASYYYKGDYARALEKLDFLMLNYPQSRFYDDALYYRGLACYKEARYGQAIVALKEAMLSKHYRTRAMVMLCLVYFRDNNYKEFSDLAGELLRERLEVKERQWVLNLLGEAQFNQSLYVDALATYDKLLSFARTPEEVQALKLKKAELYLAMCEYDTCRVFLQTEKAPEFQNILADLYVKLGDIATAKEIYSAVGIDAFDEVSSEAYYKLAELYRTEDSLEFAIASYDSATAKAPQGEYGVTSKKLADVLRRIDGLAQETLNVDRARFLIAEAYFVDLNDPAHAVVEYGKVYENFPESVWAPKALYAQFWINKMILNNDSLAQLYAENLLHQYPNTEYARSTATLLDAERQSEEP